LKNILVISYSQTGQLTTILNQICSPLEKDSGIQVDHYVIEPETSYPIPWPSEEFFRVMPDSVQGKPCKIKPLNIPDIKNYDLIILGYQVWYLSPSLPIAAFLKSSEGKQILSGKDIITVLGVRNMWVMAHKIVHSLLQEAGACHKGNIVLEDKNNNLISVLTIIKWLMHGDKGPYKHLPEAGVSKTDIMNSERFGKIIRVALLKNKKCFQPDLLNAGAVEIHYPIYQMEKNARRIFKIWAGILVKQRLKGRGIEALWLRLFKFYLLFMIFAISPLAHIVFSLKRIILFRKTSLEMGRIKNIC